MQPYRFPSPIYVTRPSLPDLSGYAGLLEDVWDRRWVTNAGPLLQQFESQLEDYTRANVSVVANGHAALDNVIRALRLSGEVITTAFTFPSTVHALVLNGLQPVFCDIGERSSNIDVDKIEPLITERTTAIMAVHVYGIPCAVDALQALASRHGLKLIYDAAHAFGVSIDGVNIANFGDAAAFSLHATKVMNSVEGGLVCFQDRKLKPMLSALKDFGYDSASGSAVEVSGNAKMSELHAAVGLLNLQRFDRLQAKRKQIGLLYEERLSRCAAVEMFPLPADNVNRNFSYMPVLVRGDDPLNVRDKLINRLLEFNVYPRKYFYPLCTNLPCYSDQDFYEMDLPNASNISDRVLCLPIYDSLEHEAVENICGIIEGFVG